MYKLFSLIFGSRIGWLKMYFLLTEFFRDFLTLNNFFLWYIYDFERYFLIHFYFETCKFPTRNVQQSDETCSWICHVVYCFRGAKYLKTATNLTLTANSDGHMAPSVIPQTGNIIDASFQWIKRILHPSYLNYANSLGDTYNVNPLGQKLNFY